MMGTRRSVPSSDSQAAPIGRPALSERRKARVEGFTLIEMLVVIVIIMILAGLLIPTVMRAICNGRAGAMRAMLSQLEQACKMYQQDHGDYPPSNGAFDSSTLSTALRKPSMRHGVYFEFRESQIDGSGNIKNSVHEEDFVKYRNNYMNKDPKAKGVHNKSSVDMWCMGCDKVVDSVNNWE